MSLGGVGASPNACRGETVGSEVMEEAKVELEECEATVVSRQKGVMGVCLSRLEVL